MTLSPVFLVRMKIGQIAHATMSTLKGTKWRNTFAFSFDLFFRQKDTYEIRQSTI